MFVMNYVTHTHTKKEKTNENKTKHEMKLYTIIISNVIQLRHEAKNERDGKRARQFYFNKILFCIV